MSPRFRGLAAIAASFDRECLQFCSTDLGVCSSSRPRKLMLFLDTLLHDTLVPYTFR
jgi:hypothetical protein